MNVNPYLSLEEFLAAPVEEIAKVAPKTLISTLAGTRRSAVFSGISPVGKDYARWSINKMITCFEMIFQQGVRHIFVSAIIPKQIKETTKGYRDKLSEFTDWGLSGPEAIENWTRLGWQVRLIGYHSLPELEATAEKLKKIRSPQNSPKVWFTVAAKKDSPWEELLAVVLQKQARTRKEAIQAFYGEDVPPATLLLGFGKPQVFPAIVPPLLMGDLQCYWTQQPGYNLDQNTFREILYDYAYLRKTWRANKEGRAEKALKYRAAWEKGPTIGLGIPLGPFWYPRPISLPPKEDR